MQNLDEDIFQIPDTAIAAWLKISGIVHLDTDTSEFPANFNFANPKDGSIGNLLAAWEENRPIGNVKSFYKTYRSLVREAKKAEPD